MFTITSSAIFGIRAIPVSIETDVSAGIPNFTIVGLPDASVRESRDRLRAAIKNSGFTFPRGHVTVNLAPAHLRKQGGLYDLPIAVSILSRTGVLETPILQQSVFVGELGLGGEVRAVRGVLPAALMAKEQGLPFLFVPKENTAEAMLVQGIQIFGLSHLRELIDHLCNTRLLEPCGTEPKIEPSSSNVCFSLINGQAFAKRGLEIAAAGGHHVLLQGPPGTGKTLLARALSSILPPLNYEEAVEITSIRSVCGLSYSSPAISFQRPFRSPHHSCSAASLIGGGTIPTPGEISLAHRGVLFLDELPEFSRGVLEHLRQPLEDGSVTIARTFGTVEFPSRFQLIAARNPCPCGFLTDPKRDCVCSQPQIHRYQTRLSGPLLDRFDLVIEVPNLETKDLTNDETLEKSSAVQERVMQARQIQQERFAAYGIFVNQEMTSALMKKHVRVSANAKTLLDEAFSNQMLSARGYFRIQKTAQTIADLAGASCIEEEHVAEALMFRLDRNYRT